MSSRPIHLIGRELCAVGASEVVREHGWPGGVLFL